MAKSKKSKDKVEMEAVETAVEGVADLAEGTDTLQAADDVAGVGKMAQAAGVSDLTTAMDAEVVAERMAQGAVGAAEVGAAMGEAATAEELDDRVS